MCRRGLTVLILALTFTLDYGAQLEELRLFKGLDQIKETFKNDSYPFADNILKAFEKECLYMEDPGMPSGKRRPLIVIDGNHRTGRNVVGMKIANMLRGRYLSHPAPCLHQYVMTVPQGTLTRRAFYLLSIYALVFSAKVHMNLNRIVIMNGHWLEQVTFSVLQLFPDSEDLPSETSNLYSLPEDLLAPDLTIYLDSRDNNLTHPRTAVKKRRCVEIYRKLQSRYPIMIQEIMPGPYSNTIERVYAAVRENLSDRLDLRRRAEPLCYY